MVEKICWPDGFICNAQLSSPPWCTLIGTSSWISPLTMTRWVSSRESGCVSSGARLLLFRLNYYSSIEVGRVLQHQILCHFGFSNSWLSVFHWASNRYVTQVFSWQQIFPRPEPMPCFTCWTAAIMKMGWQ